MSLTPWGITWFILCLIGAMLSAVSDYWFAMIFHGSYSKQFEVYPLIFLLLGFSLLFASIIVDAVTWYLRKKKTFEQKK